MVGRGSIYVGTVSNSLIAFGFIAQSELRLAPVRRGCITRTFRPGSTDIRRVLRDSFQNMSFCVEFRRSATTIGDSFRRPRSSSIRLAGTEKRRRSGDRRPGSRGSGAAFTGASTIAAINSILGGAGLALLLAYTIGLDKASVTAVGVLAAVLLFGLHLAYEYLPRRPRRPTAARTDISWSQLIGCRCRTPRPPS